jgi:hypothetical protein
MDRIHRPAPVAADALFHLLRPAVVALTDQLAALLIGRAWRLPRAAFS